MADLICPFSAPLIKRDFACRHAQDIIRRGGAEVACQQMVAHTQCGQLYNQVKLAALAAMDLEDDLLSLPHSVLVKIQYGGLLGLQKHIVKSTLEDNVEDISSLVANSQTKLSGLQNLPLEGICETIINYQPSRRRKK